MYTVLILLKAIRKQAIILFADFVCHLTEHD